jgi:prepilin-type N-terminal cleavage/methylation domain-containing protein
VKGRRGFSLIEILISMFLVAICLALLLQLFPLAQSLARSSDLTFQAAMLAQSGMESALLADSSTWTGDVACPGPHDNWVRQTRSGPLLVNNQPSSNLLLLQVSIYSGDSCLYALETVAAK